MVKPDPGLTAPIALGQKVGTMTVTAPDFPGLTVPVYAAQPCEPGQYRHGAGTPSRISGKK